MGRQEEMDRASIAALNAFSDPDILAKYVVGSARVDRANPKSGRRPPPVNGCALSLLASAKGAPEEAGLFWRRTLMPTHSPAGKRRSYGPILSGGKKLSRHCGQERQR